MRVIFLDFGGVTHPSGFDAAARSGNRTVRDVALRPFCWLEILPALLARHPDVGVVVHSNWRYARSPQDIGALLRDLRPRYLGCAPAGDRHGAIRAWLDSHPDVVSYRILDDAPQAFGDPPPPELIVCDPRTGLSGPGVQAQLRAWLQAS